MSENRNQSNENHDHQHNHDHDEHHSHHDHHAHMMEDFKKRFYISLILTIPILVLSPMIQDALNVDLRFTGDLYILFGLSTIVFFHGGWPFLKGMIDEVKQKEPGMMTLIAMAIIVAYGYSSLTVFGVEGRNFFWELATLIDIMLIGHWIEMKSVMSATSSLEKLVELMPNTAHRINENEETEEVKVTELKNGDLVLIKPGEKIPADGNIKKGRSEIDESMLTGESLPVLKETDQEVIGGSVNGEGSLTISIEKTGEESYLSQVITMVREAQDSRSHTQDLSDRMAKWLFYIAMAAGLVTFIIWILVGPSFSYALERTVTVMVIACPHALGLAAPLVVAKSTTLAAKSGLLIRKRSSFEEARNIDTVIFDKTGTLTLGEFGVSDVVSSGDLTKEEIVKFTASLESQSEHPIAKGIVNYAKEQNIEYPQPNEFESLTGKGIQGEVDNKNVKVVSPGYLKDEQIDFDESEFQPISEEGKTISFLLINDKLEGFVALADQIKESSKEAIAQLKSMNVESMMLTGDSQKVAQWVGKQLNLDAITAEVLPDEKADFVKKVQREGKRVAMTGDGVNDAPALANADLGIAIGAGTDVAMETADIVLVESNPKDVVNILDLSKATYRKMIQNLWWAAGYNIIAIPLAAGILFPIGIVLSPAIGALLMSLSTVVVAINARLFKYEKQ
ncbi:heavy metal translocating P-type ATPase [Virgibacillus necropolis]|uniref:P-type Cu(+) transporter n=1 Tax=Virgibacillus necropolis TaxID=163877 RepID=A0A221MB10_9BACI|nr:heavy metal translocating P-type ATPase [Virgibacillus necropolis]ASN04802.1 copper-translocating P-type ATPase [Virgibacillus necropolis]